jgi:hypothetical protein
MLNKKEIIKRQVERVYDEQMVDAEKFFDSNEIVQKVMNIRDHVQARKLSDWSDDELSRVAGELSVLIINLGEVVSNAELMKVDTEMMRKQAYSRKMSDLIEQGELVSKSQHLAEVDNKAWKEIENQAYYRFRTLKNLYEDTKSFVTVVQSRLGYLKTERIQSGQQV